MRTRSQSLETPKIVGDATAPGPAGMPGIAPNEPTTNPNNAATGKPAATLKCKRSLDSAPVSKAKRTQSTAATKITKGRWDLPHGMGIALATPTATALTKVFGDADTTEAESVGSSVTEARKETEAITATSGPKRQIRITFKASKNIAPSTEEKSVSEKKDAFLEADAALAKEHPLENIAVGNKDTDTEVKVEEGDGNAPIPIPIQWMTRSATKAAHEVADIRMQTSATPIAFPIGGENQEPGAVAIGHATPISAENIKPDGEGDPVDTKALAKLHPDFKKRIKRGAENPYGLTTGYSPYPNRLVPTSETCEEVHKILTDLHGEVTQPREMPIPSLEVAGCGEVPSVLDALLRTLISGNTKMEMANEAIKGLVKKFGTLEHGVGAGSINWDKVRLSPMQDLVSAIKPAGCAYLKGKQIQAILNMVHEENKAQLEAARLEAEGKGVDEDVVMTEAVDGTEGQKEGPETTMEFPEVLSLDHFYHMSKEEAMTAFLKYPGIGVKTAACVILFCLQIPCFAVDTHVHKFCQWLGWVPARATELDSFNHGEYTVPDRLKYGLHQLFIRHGQQCFKCRKATKPGTADWEEAPDCPLEHLLDRSKDDVKSKGNRIKEESEK